MTEPVPSERDREMAQELDAECLAADPDGFDGEIYLAVAALKIAAARAEGRRAGIEECRKIAARLAECGPDPDLQFVMARKFVADLARDIADGCPSVTELTPAPAAPAAPGEK